MLKLTKVAKMPGVARVPRVGSLLATSRFLKLWALQTLAHSRLLSNFRHFRHSTLLTVKES